MKVSLPSAPGPAAVRVLHLEDNEDEHLLVLAQLCRGLARVQMQRVETRADFERALAQDWDVVLSDYHLPGFTGVQALQLLQDRVAAGRAALPFILISGQMGEDTAVEAMRNGASDYLLKNNLARLVPAVHNALAVAQARRDKRAAEVALETSRARLAALAQHLQTLVEAERQAIAREIHDDVGGSLTALKFELDWMRRHAAASDVQQRAVVALETVSGAIEACQRIMQNLRPAILEQGLVAALQWLCGAFEKRSGIHCEFRHRAPAAAQRQGAQQPLDPQPLDLPAGVPLVAYRTVQEALTNVHKHAKASHVVVDLALTAGVLSLEISDNGCGVTAADQAKAKSFGLRGLHERAHTVGGWVDLSSGAAGTSLILSVPLSDQEMNDSPAFDLDAESAGAAPVAIPNEVNPSFCP